MFIVYIMSNSDLRVFFNIRNTRSKALGKFVPNYKSITSNEIYKRLRKIYQKHIERMNRPRPYLRELLTERKPKRNFIANLSAKIATDNEPIITIEPKKVSNLYNYRAFVYNFFNNLINTPRESPPPPKQIIINGIKYDTINSNDGDEFMTNFTNIITNLIQLTPINNSVDTQPILCGGYYKAPTIDHTTNSEYILDAPNLCVYNEILTLYKGIKHKGARDLDDLIDTTIKSSQDQDQEYYETYSDSGNLRMKNGKPKQITITKEHILEFGINEKMLIKTAEAIKLPLNIFKYEFEEGGHNFILVKQSYAQNDKNKVKLNCIVENNHIYLLNDINTTRRFNGIIQAYTTSKIRKQTETKKEPSEHIYNTDNLTDINFILTADNIPEKITFTNGHLNPFMRDSKKYYPVYDPLFAEYLQDDYKGQSAVSIANNYLTELKPSFMNEQIFNALNTDGVKHRTHADNIYENEEYFINGLPNPNLNIKKYDLNRAFTYAMENIDKLYSLDITSTIEQTHELNGEGLYFVICGCGVNGSVLHGDNYYSYDILQYANQIGEPFTITHKIKVSTNKNVFNEINEKIRTDYPNKGDLKPSKIIINSLSGICGIMKKSHTNLKITTDQNKIMKFLETATNPYIKREGNYFFYGYKNDTNLQTNRLITYIQILDHFNILAHKRALEVGGLLIARNIDAFYICFDNGVKKYQNRPKSLTINEPNLTHLSDKIGDFKTEPFKPLRTYETQRKVRPPIPHNFIKNKLDINDSINLTTNHIKNGLMILGIGGVGKTTAIRRLMKELGEEHFLISAPTHASAKLIGGQTIHATLNINPTTNVGTYSKTDKKYYIIDECSMITSDIWSHLLQFKKINEELIFILLGDHHQLPSVEDIEYNFNENENILSLVNGNYCELTKNYRQNDRGCIVSQKLINGDTIDYDLLPPRYDGVNICYLNQTRQEINDRLNKKATHNNKQAKEIFLNDYKNDKDEHDKKTQLIGKIYKGCPIICNKSIYKSFKNNETFTITKITDDYIFLDYEYELFITYEDFTKYFTLNYALTIYKAQGATFEGNVNIHDMKIMTENYRYIYTAISRATQYENLRFCGRS